MIGVRKNIREKIGKQPGDTVKVTVKAIWLPYDKPLPLNLICEIVVWCKKSAENNKHRS